MHVVINLAFLVAGKLDQAKVCEDNVSFPVISTFEELVHLISSLPG